MDGHPYFCFYSFFFCSDSVDFVLLAGGYGEMESFPGRTDHVFDFGEFDGGKGFGTVKG